TMLEPGKTYFLLYDFKEGRRYFMGDDCRLQNELFKFPVDWQTVSMEDEDKDFDRYIASTDSLLQTQFAKQERLFRGTSLALQSLQAISPGSHALAAGIRLRTGSLQR
ncbi:MAG: hypothetical protein IIW69_05880, partial [Bacteroidaceae bacterium]|nr:hypothetical protein [Bacteroidaceae bacterium]